MIKRLPSFAESALQMLCAEAGALCQKVSEDESGWDYLIEFAEPTHSGPADTRPPRRAAYVQVKSAQNERHDCRLKLSNALRSVQSPHPWFVVLFTRGKRRREVNIYARHVWEDTIASTLEAVRRAENEGRPLNRATCMLPFTVEKRNDDLIEWMDRQIAEIGGDYESRKKKCFETSGYEDGYGGGTLTIEASSIEELKRNFLGLGDGLTVKRFVFTPARFGLNSPTPLVNIAEGKLQISPSPVDSCEIWLGAAASSERIVLDGNVYALALPGMKSEDQTIRLSGEFLEVLWTPESGRTNCEIKFNITQPASINALEKFATLKGWLSVGPVDIQVWARGRRFLAGAIRDSEAMSADEWRRLAEVLRFLRTIAGPSRRSILTFSLRDVFRAAGLRTFHESMTASSFRIEFDPLPVSPESVTSLMYYFVVDVGPHTFFALAERAVTEDVMVGERRRITTGKAQLVEFYNVSGADDEQRQAMIDDYDRALAKGEENQHPLGLGDLREFIANAAKQNAEGAKKII